MSHEDFEYLRRKAEEERRRKEIARRKRISMLNGKVQAIYNSIDVLMKDYSRQIRSICSKAGNSGISSVSGTDEVSNVLSGFRSRLSAVSTSFTENEEQLNRTIDSLVSFKNEVRLSSGRIVAIESRVIRACGIIDDIRQTQSRIDSQLRYSSQSCREIEEAMRNYEVDSVDSYNLLQQRLTGYRDKNTELRAVSTDSDDPSVLSKISSSFSELSSRIAADDKSFDVVMGDIKARYSQRLTTEISDLIEKIRANEEARKKDKADAENIARRKAEEEQRAVLQEKKLKVVELAKKEFDDLIAEPVISSKISDAIQDLLNKFNTLKDADTFELSDVYAISIQPKIKKIRREIEEYKKLAENFNGLYAEYVVLAQYCEEEPKDYALSESSISMIQAEITRLQQAAKKRDEQLFAAEAIRHALEEMGYELIGEETSVPDSVFSSRLYRDSRGNGINAVVRSDGSGSFEFGVLSVDDHELTYNEARKAAAETKSFCSKHKKLHELLESNGLKIGNQVRSAPTPENAIAINASTFNISEEVREDIIRSAEVFTSSAAAAEEKKLYADNEQQN